MELWSDTVCVSVRRDTRGFSLSTSSYTHRGETTSRWWPSANQEESARQNPATPAPWSQNREKIKVCCLSCSVCSLLWKPKLTKILPYVHANPLGSCGQWFQDYVGPVIWRDFYHWQTRLSLLTHQMIYRRIMKKIAQISQRVIVMNTEEHKV